MSLSVLSTWAVADFTIRYLHDPAAGAVTLQLLPTARLPELAGRRATPAGEFAIDAGCEPAPLSAVESHSLVQVKRVGDSYPGAFAQGHTLRSAPAGAGFRFGEQTREVHGTRTSVVTTLVDEAAGHVIEHRLSWYEGDETVEIEVCFLNDGQEPVTLGQLTSFSLGGLAPFARVGAPGRLRVHRFRSAWSAESRHVVEALEPLHLERSWSGAGLFGEPFGRIGLMPARPWFPFVALEDTEAGVVWAARLAWAGSWRMAISRRNDDVCLSGGLADREPGHWMKTLVPGECLETPSAFLSCVAGDLDTVCDRLTVLRLEQETVGSGATGFALADYLLRCEGLPVIGPNRRF